MPNYINPFSSISMGTTSPFSLMGTISPMTSSRSIGTTSAQSSSNAWGNNIATRSKIGLYTKGSEIATRSKIGLSEIANRAKIGTGKFGGSFNSGAGTFGGSNVSSSNSRSFNNYGRIETSLTSTFKRKPTVKRYGYGDAPTNRYSKLVF